MSEEQQVAVGQIVKFAGFEEGNEIPDNGDLLEEGGEYTVAEVLETEDGQELLILDVPNPKFNAKRKASKTNLEFIQVEVFGNEVYLEEEEGEEEAETEGEGTPVTVEDLKKGQLISGIDEEGEFTGKVVSVSKKAIVIKDTESGDSIEIDLASIESINLLEDVAEEKPAAKSKATAKAPAKAAAKGKAKEEAKPAAKAKAPAKAEAKSKAPAKATGKAPVKAKAPETEEDPDLKGMLILTEEEEDQEIVELVQEADDIFSLAEEMVEATSRDEYRLGGILYHIRLSKAYKELDHQYAENEGFKLFVSDRLNVGYRKAMYLIEIYTTFNRFGLGADKAAELGWSKASMIAKVITEENKDDLVEMASTMSVRELDDNIKEHYTHLGEDQREKVKFETFKFRLIEDAAASVKNILEQAASSMGAKKLDSVFERIVTEWGMENLHVEKPAAKATARAAAAKEAPVQAKGKAPARGQARARG